MILSSLILCSIFTFLAGLHFYWGIGGKWGIKGATPSKDDAQLVLHPKSSHCFIVGTLLLLPAIFVLIKSNILKLNLPSWMLNSGLGVISVVFLLRAVGEFKYVGFFKKIRNTTFAKLDTRYFSPLCLLISILSIVLSVLS